MNMSENEVPPPFDHGEVTKENAVEKLNAAAQAADKDARIEELKAEISRLTRDQETDCEEYVKTLTEDADYGLNQQIAQLKAENERLRDVAQRARQYCEYGNGCGGATKLPSGEWFDEGDGTLYHAIISVISPANQLEASNNPLEELPADGGGQWVGDMSNESFDKWLRILKKSGQLTVREDGGNPFKIKFVDGFYTGADCVNDTLNDVIDWVSRRGGLEFLVPADGNGVEDKDENGLLPCPFCGSKADFLTFELQAFKGFEIRCSNQSCNVYKQTAPLNYWPMPQLDRQKAKWNTRAGRGIGG